MQLNIFLIFFEIDLNVTKKYNIDVLEKYYLRYKDNNDDKISDIKMGYEYLKTILKECNKFEVNSNILKSILQSYKSLNSSIGAYSFCSHWENSYSDLRNKKILFEISLFQPFVEGILKNIDYYFENVSELEKNEEFYIELVKRLECLNNILDNSNSDLLNAQYEYHNTWNDAKRGFHRYVTDSELGFAKKIED